MADAHLSANDRHAPVDVGEGRLVLRVRVANVEGMPVQLEGEGRNKAACKKLAYGE